MPLYAANALSTQRQKGALSYVPVFGQDSDSATTQFVFWDAVQATMTLRLYPNLVFEKNLGSGATFVVNLYRDSTSTPEDPKLVAVKSPITQEEFRGRDQRSADLYSLLREIQVLQHPPLQDHANIVKVIGMDWAVNGADILVPRLIVEFAQFGTLSSFLREEGLSSWEETLELCLDVASGLERIHSCGIVHGDLKLDNILVFTHDTRRVIAKISDFGCALTFPEPGATRRYLGTRNYTAPELQSNPVLSLVDLQRCDIYAFGLCLWETVSHGQRYYEACDLAHLYTSDVDLSEDLATRLRDFHIAESRNDVGASGVDIPSSESARTAREALAKLLRHCIHPIPFKRHTVPQVVHILQRLCKPRVVNPPEYFALFKAPLRGTFTYASGAVPFDVQKDTVSELLHEVESRQRDSRSRAAVLLSICYTYGAGVQVDFSKALEYLQEAAATGHYSAEATLLRTAAALGVSAEEASRGDSIVRQDLLDLESRLADRDPRLNYVYRLREWGNLMDKDEQQKRFKLDDARSPRIIEAPWTLTDVQDLFSPGHSINIENAMVIDAPNHYRYAGDESKWDLLQWVAFHGWVGLLESLTKSNESALSRVLTANPDDMQLGSTGDLFVAACMRGRTEVVEYLLGKNLAANHWEGLSSVLGPLSFLFAFVDEDVDKVSSMLVRAGARPNLAHTGKFGGLGFAAIDQSLSLSGPPLEPAIWVGDIRAIRALLKHGADPLQTLGLPTFNCLNLAVSLHLDEAVALFLAHMSQTCKESDTPMPNLAIHWWDLLGIMLGARAMSQRWLLHGSDYEAACLRTVDLLCRYGASINPGDSDVYLPVIEGSKHPSQRYVLEHLLRRGADPNQKNRQGEVALMACREKAWHPADNAATCRLLIKGGADVNAVNEMGSTAVHYHAAYSAETLRVILDAGAHTDTPNKHGYTPLFWAVQTNTTDCINLLLDRGASAEATTRLGSRPEQVTPLGWAAALGLADSLRTLLDRGVSIWLKEAGTTVLNLAADCKQAGILRIMVQEYSSIFCEPTVLNGLDARLFTPLQLAASRTTACVEPLLQAEVDLDFREPSGAQTRTALAVAIEHERLEVALCLLEQGASVFCRGDPAQRYWTFLSEYVRCMGRTPALRAKFSNFLVETRPWIDSHGLLGVRNWAGQTILHTAVYYCQATAVKTLVDFGVSLRDRVDGCRFAWTTESAEFAKRFSMTVGLDVLEYARLLRSCSPEDRRVWAECVNQELSMEELDEIIVYLQAFPELGCL